MWWKPTTTAKQGSAKEGNAAHCRVSIAAPNHSGKRQRQLVTWGPSALPVTTDLIYYSNYLFIFGFKKYSIYLQGQHKYASLMVSVNGKTGNEEMDSLLLS
jgi:hypothetical protein